MPTVFSHPAPVLALAALLGGRVSTRMLLFGILCAVLPDADVIGFRFGISYADAFGHRGFSHSLAFALLMGCAGFGVAPLFLRGSRLMGFTVGLLAVSSHILLDAMTNGGLGVAALRPNPVLLRLAPYPGFAVRPQGAPVATGALRHALRIALGMGSVSGCHSRRLVFREEPYACHPPEITPIPRSHAHSHDNSWNFFHKEVQRHKKRDAPYGASPTSAVPGLPIKREHGVRLPHTCRESLLAKTTLKTSQNRLAENTVPERGRGTNHHSVKRGVSAASL